MEQKRKSGTSGLPNASDTWFSSTSALEKPAALMRCIWKKESWNFILSFPTAKAVVSILTWSKARRKLLHVRSMTRTPISLSFFPPLQVHMFLSIQTSPACLFPLAPSATAV